MHVTVGTGYAMGDVAFYAAVVLTYVDADIVGIGTKNGIFNKTIFNSKNGHLYTRCNKDSVRVEDVASKETL